MKKLHLILLVLLCTSVSAEEINFSCQDPAYVAGSMSLQYFDLVVESNTGDIWQYPMYIGPGCNHNEKGKTDKKDCSISSTNVSCECESDMAFTHMQLSRNTAVLAVRNTYKNDGKTLSNEYLCKRVSKKAF